MTNHNLQRGFVTIATGNEKYYQLALNLLHSYRLHCKDDTPFALLCDRDHPAAAEFDHVVVMETCYRSYLDKLQLAKWSPYEETLFVDADSLFLQDPSCLWDDFSQGGDFSCYGQELPLESTAGWYDHQKLKELSGQVFFNVSMHGGVYYFRKTELCRNLFEQAVFLSENFSRYGFRYFDKPADEPVLALAMAAAKCTPCAIPGRIIFVPSVGKYLRVAVSGKLYIHRRICEHTIIHFTTGNTRRFMYHYLLNVMESQRSDPNHRTSAGNYLTTLLRFLPLETAVRLYRIARKILPPSFCSKLRNLVK